MRTLLILLLLSISSFSQVGYLQSPTNTPVNGYTIERTGNKNKWVPQLWFTNSATGSITNLNNSSGVVAIYPEGNIIWGDVDPFLTWWGGNDQSLKAAFGVDAALGHTNYEMEFGVFSSISASPRADANFAGTYGAEANSFFNLEARSVGLVNSWYDINCQTSDSTTNSTVQQNFLYGRVGAATGEAHSGIFNNTFTSGTMTILSADLLGPNVIPLDIIQTSADFADTSRWRLSTNNSIYTVSKLRTNAPAINAIQTWNRAGETFQGIRLNITNSASQADSKSILVQSNSIGVFEVYPNGRIDTVAEIRTPTITLTNNPTLQTTNAAPAGFSVGVTVPAVWFVVTNAGNRYLIPGYTP